MLQDNNINIDPQIKSDYDRLMKGYREDWICSEWEKCGENYKQFSIYPQYYYTKESNCISNII